MLKSYSCESSQDKKEICNPERGWNIALNGVYGILVVKSYIKYGNLTPYIEQSSINESPLFSILGTVGTSLIEVNDDQRLVQAVMDSITGMSSVLVMRCRLTLHAASLVEFGKGFLHSDVSIGNVLITSQHKDNVEIPVT